MSEERKKSGAEDAVDKAEARARGKVLDAIAAWVPLRRAQHELAEDAVDKAEARARGKVLDAIAAWVPLRRAQHELAEDACADLDAATELLRAIAPRLPS